MASVRDEDVPDMTGIEPSARRGGAPVPKKMDVTEELLRSLPKTDLPCHLDGSLRLKTILELAEQILAHRPGQRIIFMSAYPAEVLAEHGLQDLEVLFLAKPYTMEELQAKVRQAVERSPSPRVDPAWRARQQ
jgi:two-component SAPR family response regulator